MSRRNVAYDMSTGIEDEHMMVKRCGDEWLSSRGRWLIP